MGCRKLTYSESLRILKVVSNNLKISVKCYAGDYRYGYQGMEKDDEVKGEGNSYDFGARMYDSRIGRWLSRDPMQGKQPFASPYKAFHNSPIVFIDPDGNTEYKVHIVIDAKTGTKTITIKTARGVMKDGLRHIWFGEASYYNVATWYDFATTTVTVMDDGEVISEEVDQRVLKENGEKQTDIIFFSADKDGTIWVEGDPRLEEGVERSFGLAGSGSSGGVIGQDWSKNAVGDVNYDDLELLFKPSGLSKGYKPGSGSWVDLPHGDAKRWLTWILKESTEGSQKIKEILDEAQKMVTIPEIDVKDKFCKDCKRTFNKDNEEIKDDGKEKDTITFDKH